MANIAITSIEAQLDSIEKKIHEIIDAPEPVDNTLYKEYLNQQIKGVKFLDELDEVKLVFGFTEKVELVSRKKFVNMLKSADSSNIEFDGEFCKLALLENVNSPTSLALYVASAESI